MCKAIHHPLETQLSLPTPYGRILSGGALSILVPSQILSTIAVFSAAFALLQTGNPAPPAATAAIVLCLAPAALGLAVAIGVLFSLRATAPVRPRSSPRSPPCRFSPCPRGSPISCQGTSFPGSTGPRDSPSSPR